MIKAIALTTGYVEDQKVGLVWFTHPTGFKTREEAIKSLAEDLKECWSSRVNYSRNVYIRHLQKDCCKNNVGTGKYCRECGSKLTTEDDPFDYELFRDEVLYNLPGYTCDRWPFEEGEWWPWTSLKELLAYSSKEIHHIEEQAEHVLVDAIRPKEE